MAAHTHMAPASHLAACVGSQSWSIVGKDLISEVTCSEPYEWSDPTGAEWEFNEKAQARAGKEPFHVSTCSAFGFCTPNLFQTAWTACVSLIVIQIGSRACCVRSPLAMSTDQTLRGTYFDGVPPSCHPAFSCSAADHALSWRMWQTLSSLEKGLLRLQSSEFERPLCGQALCRAVAGTV